MRRPRIEYISSSSVQGRVLDYEWVACALLFFFSSRRRHTRSDRDWSSDVCSSDLYELTPRGMRRIGQNALSDLFARLAKDRLGRHETDPTGVGHERAYETKAYEFGEDRKSVV